MRAVTASSPGKNGHLYTDNGMVMVCFTDDGRAKPFPTKLFKTRRLLALRPSVRRLQQEGDFEFIAEIEPSREAITDALFRVLRVKRFKVTKGVPATPEQLEKLRQMRQESTNRSLGSIAGG